ncbi:prephenate dehydratase [Amylibacter sp. IMCC11727]|mgnify:CR=1 FL=1|uniref:prephenate dehydratase n=1 Tax=Amylibacter sp. IMCC11727 TaxID=3039851 RepID=UPI00244DDE5D|nr:prephenate dehydratase [Amylibacter sp. IMCC11727]WGI21480.1 prephenate dehydratase [Amylibacter sp. IMCC11727]
MVRQVGKIAFQGELGAYSHQACVAVYPDGEPIACKTFESAIATVNRGDADVAMLPVENSTYGRVADVHYLLPESGLHIIGEHFERVHINLLGVPGAKIEDMTSAKSHTVLLGQCRKFLKEHNLLPVTGADTAGSAQEVAAAGDKSQGALAGDLTAGIYGLDVLAQHIEDNQNNTTRFLIMSPEPAVAPQSDKELITTFVFRVRNIPAALYKAMGGFATNGVNMVKLESYMIGGSFTATQFYADIVGHPDDAPVKRAMEELAYFTDYLEVLGVYEADKSRG